MGTREEHLEGVVSGLLEAIETFVDEKITYERRRLEDPEWACPLALGAARDELEEQIRELVRRTQ